MKEEQKDKNPFNYFYKPGTKVEIDGGFITNAIDKLKLVLGDEVTEKVSYRYSYVNTETGKTVKKYKDEDLKSGKVVKIADIDKMMNAEPDRAITPKGMEVLFLMRYLESIHQQNIEKGIALHATELPVSEDESKFEIDNK